MLKKLLFPYLLEMKTFEKDNRTVLSVNNLKQGILHTQKEQLI